MSGTAGNDMPPEPVRTMGSFVGQLRRSPVFTSDVGGRKVAEIELCGHFFAEDKSLVLVGNRVVTVMCPAFVGMLELGEVGMPPHIDRLVNYEADAIIVK